jgi:hypothetical protein
LANGDGREIAVGVTHKVDGQPKLCKRGLPGSKRIIDALKYASSPIVWRVDIGGTVVGSDDKLCGTKRTYLSGGIDITPILREWARECALSVIHLWDAPEIVVRWLKTGDESIRAAAKDAARAAIWAAAWDAARDAAGAAIWAAAGDVASAAAKDAARAAIWAAAGAVASAAARDAYNTRLTAMVNKAIKAKGGE